MPPQSQAQPAQEPAYQDFIKWVDKNRVHGTLGPSDAIDCPFMPFSLLKSHLEAPRRLRDILRSLFPQANPPISPGDIWRSGISRIFAILILIGHGRHIQTMRKHHNLRDESLPFLKEPPHFPKLADGDTSIWDAFYKMQFQFCAHEFKCGVTDTELEEDTVLPIIGKELIRHGGSAAIYKIKLHAEYDHLSSRDQSDQVMYLPTHLTEAFILITGVIDDR